MKISLLTLTSLLFCGWVLAQHATGQSNGDDNEKGRRPTRSSSNQEIVTVDGVTYPQAELPFTIRDHLVLSQSGICIGFFLKNSDIVYGAKSGVPVGYIAADRYLYFSFPTK